MNNDNVKLPEELWTVAELAAYLKVSEESIRQNARKGKISGYKTGPGPQADWRFDKAQIREFLSYRPKKEE